MKPIIDPINKDELAKELTVDKFVRHTNKGKNEIYIFDYHNSPNLMLEVARLREISFREAGGGTGQQLDLDIYDIQPSPYMQLIVWNPEEKEIIGGYRYAMSGNVSHDGAQLANLTIQNYFELSDEFIRDYLPYSIELGRAFVQPKYQSTVSGSKSLFALDNLWDGLGSLIAQYPEVKYFYGKVTIYNNFSLEGKALLLNFLNAHFENDTIMRPKKPVNYDHSHLVAPQQFGNLGFDEEYKLLKKQFQTLGITIPPLINSYISLSPSLKVFGTYHDDTFGNVDETGIMITIADLYPHKVNRHVLTHAKNASLEIA